MARHSLTRAVPRRLALVYPATMPGRWHTGLCEVPSCLLRVVKYPEQRDLRELEMAPSALVSDEAKPRP